MLSLFAPLRSAAAVASRFLSALPAAVPTRVSPVYAAMRSTQFPSITARAATNSAEKAALMKLRAKYQQRKRRHMPKVIPLPDSMKRVLLPEAEVDSPKAMKTDLLNFLEHRAIQKRRSQIPIPYFTPGSIVSVTRVDAKSSPRRRGFVGICVAKYNKGYSSSFTLRNYIRGHAIELTFPLYSPLIIDINVIKLQRFRRAKLYYLRNRPPSESTVDMKLAKMSTQL